MVAVAGGSGDDGGAGAGADAGTVAVTAAGGSAGVLMGLGLALLPHAGIALGIFGGLGTTHLLGSLLFGIGAVDPTSFGVAAAALLAANLGACLPPAWWAARVEPLDVLRRG